jgi:hypothetical protein
MLKKILLDNQKYHFSKTQLPILIHGNDGLGASLFTMSVLADLYSQESKIVALTGFPMAREEFEKQLGEHNKNKAVFFLKKQTEKFIDFVKTQHDINERIILIKNIELHDKEVFDFIKDFEKIIISGDINKCAYKDTVVNKHYVSKIYFSQFDLSLPPLQKYQGYLVAPNINGIVSLET